VQSPLDEYYEKYDYDDEDYYTDTYGPAAPFARTLMMFLSLLEVLCSLLYVILRLVDVKLDVINESSLLLH
jgi:hypothetical protein